MNTYLNGLRLPIIIWTKVNDSYICEYHNNKLITLNNTITIDNYINKMEESYKKIYREGLNELLTPRKTEIMFNVSNKSICLNKLNINKILEIHYPQVNNVDILSVISYKIRNPLTNIIGSLTVIDTVNFTQETLDLFNILKNASYEIIGVTNDIIDVVNYSKSNIIVNKKYVNLKELLYDVYGVVKTKAYEKRITLNIRVNDNLPNTINVDIDQLKQLLVKIIDNAINFSETNNTIVIEALLFESISNYDCPYEYIECTPNKYNILFRVKDSGQGMTNEKKEFLINMFKESNNEYNTIYNNSGFGLLISKYICNYLQGNIWFKSILDVGTTFYFNIICEGYSTISIN